MPPTSVKLVSRDVPLPVVRVASMFVTAAKRDQEKTSEIADGDHADFVEKVWTF